MVSNMGFNVLAIPFSYVGWRLLLRCQQPLNAYLLYRGLAKADVYHFSRKSAVFSKSFRCSLSHGGLLWYNCPSIEEWAAMTFLMRCLLASLVNRTGCGRLFRRIGAIS